MKCLINNELLNFTKRALKNISRSRFLLSGLDSCIQKTCDTKVCCLYGLQLTGKTTMMMQEIERLGAENCAYIICGTDDYTFTLKATLEGCKDKRYIFVDEVTSMYDFIEASAFLADYCAMSVTRVVMSGADSLGLWLANNNALRDRAHLLHTTYIPFAEYNHISGKDVLSYIRYGGTLSPENVFYDSDSLSEYVNSAIAHNILSVLQRWNAGRNVGLMNLSTIPERELPRFIKKVLEALNKSFLLKVINDSFNPRYLSSTAQPLSRGVDIDDYEADEQAVSTIISYLEKIDVLYHVPKTEEYIFTQCGMRYCQAAALTEALFKSEDFDVYSKSEKDTILKALEDGICGGILEDVIFYQFVKTLDKGCSVSKYRSADNKKTAILISNPADKRSAAVEVAFSEEQTTHFTDEKFCDEIGKNVTDCPVKMKAVIYIGKTAFGEDVSYINAEEFLLSAKEHSINMLFKRIPETDIVGEVSNEQ